MLHILLIEDNPGDVLLVQQALETHNVTHDLHLVRDGAQALNFLEHMGHKDDVPCPDVILLDLNLPKVDGAQVLAEFRKRPECASTPVIIITSSGAQRDRARVSALGISSYFKKPLDLDEFLQLGAIVRQVVGKLVA